MVDFADSLRESIPTVMRALAQASNTGVLNIRGRGSEAEFRFFRGDIVSARASSSRPLGEALAERGAISRNDLDSVLALQRRKKQRQPIATILVEFGLVEKEVVETELQIQVLEVLRMVLDWGGGEYSFAPRTVPAGVELSCALPATGHVDQILEGAGVPL